MELRFHPSAIKDARELYQYYSSITLELGDEFWCELEEFLEYAREHPRRRHFTLVTATIMASY